jgi:type I restriction enzyme S subunit
MEAKQGLLPELLPFLVCNDKFFDHAVKHSAGGLSPRTKFKDLANYEFLLPPKDQQAKLAELLWAADAMVENQNRLYSNSLKLRDSACKDSLNYGYSRRCPSIPSGWKFVKMKDIGKVNAGSTPLRSVNKYFEGGTIPWVKTLDLNNGIIEQTEESITELALKKTSCNIRPVGSVLVAMYGGWNQIGRTGLLHVSAATNQAVSAVMPDAELVRSDYLLYLLNTNVSYWRKVAISSRKDPNITKDDVEKFPVPLPSLEIQDLIVKKIKRVISEVEQIHLTIKHSKQLQKSLINQIF